MSARNECTYPEKGHHPEKDDHPTDGRGTIPTGVPTAVEQDRRPRVPPLPWRQGEDGLDDRQHPQRRQAFEKVFQPGGSRLRGQRVGHTGLPEIRVIQGLHRIHVKIDDRVSNKTKQKHSQHQDGHRQAQLRKGTTDPARPGEPLQPVLEPARRTLPEIPLAVIRVRMAPGLQASFVDITRGSLALARAHQPAGFRVRRLVDDSRAGLEEVRDVFGRRQEGREDRLETDPADPRGIMLFGSLLRGLSGRLGRVAAIVSVWGLGLLTSWEALPGWLIERVHSLRQFGLKS